MAIPGGNIFDFLLKGKDIVDTVKDTKNDIMKPRTGDSIKTRAQDLILQYPVLMSDAITPESASAVCRTLEHEYANLLVLIINDRAIVSGDDAFTATDFLKQFHNNKLESANLTTQNDIKDANIALNEQISSVLFNYENINDCTLDKEVVRSYNEAKKRMKGSFQPIDKYADEKEARAVEKHGWDKDDRELKNKKLNKELLKMDADMTERSQVNITPNDAKKLNDVVPTLIKGMINFKVGENVINRNIHFGVKCMCHPIKSSEMKFNLSTKVGNPSLMMKFIEWTTGEKRLLTDLIMERNTMKRLATTKMKSNYWFRRLEKMSNSAETKSIVNNFFNNFPMIKSAAKLITGSGNMPIPTVSLVISKSEVDQIESETGVNLLTNKSFAPELMRRFYLLSLVVVDDVSNTVYFYNEVSQRFIQYSMKQLKGFAKDDLLTPEEALKKSLMR